MSTYAYICKLKNRFSSPGYSQQHSNEFKIRKYVVLTAFRLILFSSSRILYFVLKVFRLILYLIQPYSLLLTVKWRIEQAEKRIYPCRYTLCVYEQLTYVIQLKYFSVFKSALWSGKHFLIEHQKILTIIYLKFIRY